MVGKTWGEGHTMAKSMSGSCLPHFDGKLPAITLKALLYSLCLPPPSHVTKFHNLPKQWHRLRNNYPNT